MKKFKHGDKVRCISKDNSDHHRDDYRDAVEVGNVYTVIPPREVRRASSITLKEVNQIHIKRPIYHENDFELVSDYVNPEDLEEAYKRAMSIL